MECRNCKNSFEIADSDRVFLNKVSPEINGQKLSISEPTYCPECRLQRRMAHRNDRNLYKRKCDKTGKILVTPFRPEVKVKVYDKDYWWGDDFDAKDYGRDFDFNRPFFEQFQELMQEVPHPHVMTLESENSLYTNYNYRNKNCYLCFAGNHLEDSLYCYNTQSSRDCVDCLFTYDSELCYECVQCTSSYNLKFSLHCRSCSDSAFLEDCRNCKNCFMCWNLDNAEYCFMNQKYSKEEYEEKVKEFTLKNYSKLKEMVEKWKTDRVKFVKKENHNIMAEDCTGEYIQNSKNCKDCYLVGKDCEDLKYVLNAFPSFKDAMDCSYSGENSELHYECMASGSECTNNLFGNISVAGSHNVMYCAITFGLKNCFGCGCLRNSEYCILNKQYYKEEYEELVPKIMEHMKKHGEWGEYFPISISSYAYNETLAHEYFPLTKEEAVSKGYSWKEEDPKEYKDQNYTIPENIDDVDDSILDEMLACEECGKNYKIVQQELNFYKKQGIAAPRECFDCRHKSRVALMNPRKLWGRECDKCSAKIRSSYSPDRPEKVYCEKCYLEEVV